MRKEVVPFHKRSRAMWEKVARSRKKWRDSGKKLGVSRMKVPLFAQKVSDFSATLGREREQVGTSKKQVAVIAR